MPRCALLDVPYDDSGELQYLFVGEEVLYSIRLFGSGYRIYNLLKNVVFHYYERKDEPRIWNDAQKNEFYKHNELNTAKLKRSLKLENRNDANGNPLPRLKPKFFVSDESLQEYYTHFGIDVTNKSFRNLCQ